MKIACPKCGANTQYIPEENKCYCEYCGSLIKIEELQKEDNKKLQNTNIENIEYNDYTCSSCGAKLISAESMLITDCVYCGSKQFIKGKFKSGFMPDKIIPFKIKKEECVKIYNEYIKNGNEIPFNKVKDLRIVEIKGVYVPFHKYIYENTVDIKGCFEVINTQDYFSNNPVTRYMNLRQALQMEIPQCASSKMQSKILNKLEKFDFENAEKFHPAYLTGVFAEVPDKSKEREAEGANARCMQETNNFIRRTGYKLMEGDFKGDITELGYELIMLPIWFLTCECEGKLYKFVMNGQTGKFVSLINLRKLPNQESRIAGGILVIIFFIWLVYLFLSHFASVLLGDWIKIVIGILCVLLCIWIIKSIIQLQKEEKKKARIDAENFKKNPDSFVPYSWNCNLLDRKVYLESRFANEEDYRKKCPNVMKNDIKYIVSKDGKNAKQVYLYKDNT